MIRAFRYGDTTISLIPDIVLNNKHLNIFAADSMTLLVGPNGSGKTKFLNDLSEAVLDPESAGAQAIKWLDNDVSSSTCVIYFTPVPYLHNQTVFSERYERRKFERSGQQKPDFETAGELSESFGLDASPTLSLKTSHDDLYFFAANFVFTTAYSKYSAEKIRVSDSWFLPLLHRYIENQEWKARLSGATRGEKLDPKDAEEWDACRREAEHINLEFETLLSKHIEEAPLKLRALRHTWHKSKKSDIRIELVRRLGFTLKISPKRKQPAAVKSYDAALQTLRDMATFVGDGALRKRIYKLNRREWKDLAKLQLDDLATLSSLGLSSGTFALLEQFASIKQAIRSLKKKENCKNLLLLIDEGDAFLHWEWQQRYVEYLDKIIRNSWKKSFDCVQVVLATHSPVLMSDFPRDNIHELSNPGARGLSFGAPLESVVRSTARAGSLGLFSVRVLRNLVRRIERGDAIEPYFISMVDDPVIRNHIEKISEDRTRRSSSE